MPYFLSFCQKKMLPGKGENIRDLGCGEKVNSEDICKRDKILTIIALIFVWLQVLT